MATWIVETSVGRSGREGDGFLIVCMAHDV